MTQNERGPASGSVILVVSALLVATFAANSRAVTIRTVPIGNSGNAGEVQSQGIFGAVAYEYRIGTTEVTNAQYAEFLNAKAASDPMALYNTNMDSDGRGGITRSGSSGSYNYTVKTDMGDKPVNWVGWYDAVRFANWLHNGQGSGDTETGAYTLLGGTPTPSNGLSITRNSGALWFLTSEDEWYKAAYHQPAAQGGDTDNYWLFPTASNTAPTIATADSVGNISNPGSNVANYYFEADWNSQDGNVTTVGSAGPLSESYYGTSDQGGNVWEWNEALISGSFRGLRGGSWGLNEDYLQSFNPRVNFPTLESSNVGLRVATVPEPSTLALAAFGVAGLATCGWLRKRPTPTIRGARLRAKSHGLPMILVSTDGQRLPPSASLDPQEMRIYRRVGRAVAVVIAIVLSLSADSDARAQVPLTYQFDVDSEGWIGSSGGGYRSSGGNPGGYVTGLEQGGSNGYVHRTTGMPTDLSPYVGGLVSFDVRTSNPDLRVWFYFSGSPFTFAERLSLDTQWTRISIPFIRSAFTTGLGTPLDTVAWSSAVSNSDGLYVLAAPFIENLGDIDLDNFSLAPGSRVDPPPTGPGSSPQNPVLPIFSAPGEGFSFVGVPNGGWGDPPAAYGFTYTMASESLFTYILDFPTGFDDLFEVLVGEVSLGTFGPGQEVDFTSMPGGGVSSFKISGINPTVDSEDPLAFPLRLGFNTPTADFVMQPLIVPEPPAITLAAAALFGLTALGWQRRRVRSFTARERC